MVGEAADVSMVKNSQQKRRSVGDVRGLGHSLYRVMIDCTIANLGDSQQELGGRATVPWEHQRPSESREEAFIWAPLDRANLQFCFFLYLHRVKRAAAFKRSRDLIG